jgi:hypothetical protein
VKYQVPSRRRIQKCGITVGKSLVEQYDFYNPLLDGTGWQSKAEVLED